MEIVTVNRYAVVSQSEVYRTVKNGTVYVATESDNSYTSLYDASDFCGHTLVNMNDYGRYEVTPCCKWCDSTNGYRVSESLAAAYEHGYAEEALERLTDRVGMAALRECYHGGYTASKDCSGASYLVVDEGEPGNATTAERAYDDAVYICGLLRSWESGSMTLEELEGSGIDLDELIPSDCSDFIGGIVWDNVDCYGFSTPTDLELSQQF